MAQDGDRSILRTSMGLSEAALSRHTQLRRAARHGRRPRPSSGGCRSRSAHNRRFRVARWEAGERDPISFAEILLTLGYEYDNDLLCAPAQFHFDHCFDSTNVAAADYADQGAVFERVGIPMLAKLWCGYSCCTIAYGCTKSGKTYSMYGAGGSVGLIPRVLEFLFDGMERKHAEDLLRVGSVSHWYGAQTC